MDPDPAIFVIDLQDASKKLIFNTIFSAYYFMKVHLHHFSKIKSQKESQNRKNQGFSYYFCMMMEGSGSGSIPLTGGSDPGDPKTCGSGSGTLGQTLYSTRQEPSYNCVFQYRQARASMYTYTTCMRYNRPRDGRGGKRSRNRRYATTGPPKLCGGRLRG